MSDETKAYKIPKESDYRFAWTFADVARELQCSKRMVQKLVKDNRIPFAKVGRLVRFCPAKINEWIKNGGTR